MKVLLTLCNSSFFIKCTSPSIVVQPSEKMAWSFYSKNKNIGQQINVDMLKAIRVLENISGEKLVHKADLEGNEINDVSSTVSLKEQLAQQKKKIAELEALVKTLVKNQNAKSTVEK